MFTLKYDLNVAGTQDTGLKTVAGNIIYAKLLDSGALPNATSKNVAHGLDDISLAAGAFFKVMSGYASKADTLTDIHGLALTYEINDTNLVLTTGVDLSSWTASTVVIMFEKDDISVS